MEEAKKLTQRERVLKTLREADGGWVDGMIFLNGNPPITQFHARIWELQREGYRIISRTISGKNWKEYMIIVEPKQQRLTI